MFSLGYGNTAELYRDEEGNEMLAEGRGICHALHIKKVQEHKLDKINTLRYEESKIKKLILENKLLQKLSESSKDHKDQSTTMLIKDIVNLNKEMVKFLTKDLNDKLFAEKYNKGYLDAIESAIRNLTIPDILRKEIEE